MSGAVNVFISYAHEDGELKDQLLQHLAGLLNDGLIRVWHDRDIQAGENWISRIDNALEISSLVLLLISPSFLASSYCYGAELQRALRRASKGETTVIPIILRPSDWHTHDLRELQALPRDGKPVTSWPNRDEAFLEVVEGLRTVIESRHPQDPPPTSTSETPPADLRYYLYISDAKVDMLLPQIVVESPESSRAAERTEGTRIQRLNTVLRHLERGGRIGSVDDPSDYVRGVHELYWGHFHRSNPHDEMPPTIVAFSGATATTDLLMCGTTRHLVGARHPEGPAGFSSSHVPYLLNALSTAVEIDGASPASITRRPAWATEETALPTHGRELALWLVEDARWHMQGAEQKLEFVAKPLLSGPSRRAGRRCLLASPLYVALSM